MEEPNRMKTRAEIEAELKGKGQENALKIDLKKFNDELNSSLNRFLKQIREEKAKVEVSHSLSEISEINALKTSINSLEIPKEIKLSKHIQHSTDAVSHKFLWWYFAISSVMMMICIAVAIHYYTDAEVLAEKREDNAYAIGRKKGREDMYYALPEKSREYLKKLHPEFFSN